MRGVKTLYRAVIHGTHPSDSITDREHTADEGQSDGLVVHIELTTIHDSFGPKREDRSPKQTELELGLGDPLADNRETPSESTLQVFPSRRHSTTIQRREEILRRDQLDFNKCI